MIQSGDKNDLRNKYAELVEFLRSNLPDGAKKLIVENDKLMTYVDDDGRLPVSSVFVYALAVQVHWACSGGCLPFVELAVGSNHDLLKKADDSGFTPLVIILLYHTHSLHSDDCRVCWALRSGQVPSFVC